MIEIVYAIAAVFVLILLGVWLRIHHIPSEEYWSNADKLVYWVLFPALLFHKTSTVDITQELVQPIFTVLIAGMVISVAVAWAGGRTLGFTPQANASIVQAAGRHNTYIALAIAERLSYSTCQASTWKNRNLAHFERNSHKTFNKAHLEI